MKKPATAIRPTYFTAAFPFVRRKFITRRLLVPPRTAVRFRFPDRALLRKTAAAPRTFTESPHPVPLPIVTIHEKEPSFFYRDTCEHIPCASHRRPSKYYGELYIVIISLRFATTLYETYPVKQRVRRYTLHECRELSPRRSPRFGTRPDRRQKRKIIIKKPLDNRDVRNPTGQRCTADLKRSGAWTRVKSSKHAIARRR